MSKRQRYIGNKMLYLERIVYDKLILGYYREIRVVAERNSIKMKDVNTDILQNNWYKEHK